jgi:hypothetical protein
MRPVQFLVAGRKPRAAMQTEGIGSAGHVGWRLGSYDALSNRAATVHTLRCPPCTPSQMLTGGAMHQAAALAPGLSGAMLATHTRARASGCAKRTNSRQPKANGADGITQTTDRVCHARHAGRLQTECTTTTRRVGWGDRPMLDWDVLGLLPTQLYHHRRRSEASGQGPRSNIPQACARRLFSIAVAEGDPQNSWGPAAQIIML